MPLNIPPISPDEIGSVSSQQFDETVQIALAGEYVPPVDWGYEFSNGHRFYAAGETYK